MGIDIYMYWRKQTSEERRGQAGYLRESYHGGPYVTRYLVAEAFARDIDYEENYRGEPIPAAVLRQRLPIAVMMAIYRRHVVYGEGENPGFVTLKGGKDAKGIPEDMKPLIADIFGRQIPEMIKGTAENDLAEQTTPEQIRSAEALIEARQLPDYCLTLVDFVRLAEAQERATGEPVTVVASY